MRKVGAVVNIPFTVGGGIGSVSKVAHILRNGADKVSVNSAVVRKPKLAEEISMEFGSQCLVVAVDAKQIGGSWYVHTHGGTRSTEIDLYEWVQRMEDAGAGEILFTSMDHDGTKNGFACEALCKMSEMLSIPIIASGGAGEMKHFSDAFKIGKADATLAASVFHFHEIDIPDLKEYLKSDGVPMRI